jgi:uncharacterized protein
MITIELLLKIKDQLKINFWGMHGVLHWHHVYLNGRILSQQEGVNQTVLDYFSIFHDSCRENDGIDPDHGRRGVELAIKFRDLILLDDDEFSLLQTACALHNSAVTHNDITIQCCFSSDRLDLGRVVKYLDPAFLCSPMARQKDIIEQCYRRSHNHVPDAPFGLTDFWDVFKADRYTKWARGIRK